MLANIKKEIDVDVDDSAFDQMQGGSTYELLFPIQTQEGLNAVESRLDDAAVSLEIVRNSTLEFPQQS